jgi:hypothetical protein
MFSIPLGVEEGKRENGGADLYIEGLVNQSD